MNQYNELNNWTIVGNYQNEMNALIDTQGSFCNSIFQLDIY